MRLIDADAIDYDGYWNRNGEGFTIDVCQKAQRIIDEQPTIPSAEAVPEAPKPSGDPISRAEAIDAVMAEGRKVYTSEYASAERVIYEADAVEALSMLPSADAVSREVYEETYGVVTIEKQNAKEVGEIKHIVIHSPNYTRYFYNESMPLPPEAVQGEWKERVASGDFGSHWYEYECSVCGNVQARLTNCCSNCGAKMTKGGEDE